MGGKVRSSEYHWAVLCLHLLSGVNGVGLATCEWLEGPGFQSSVPAFKSFEAVKKTPLK